MLFRHIRELIEGVKELKMHHARRHEFVDDVLIEGGNDGPPAASFSAIASTTRPSPGDA